MEKKCVAKVNAVRYEGYAEVEVEGGAKDLVILFAMIMDHLAESMCLEPVELMAHLAARIASARLKRKRVERASAKGEC